MRALLTRLQRILRKTGVELTVGRFPRYESFEYHVKKIAPTLVLDVGANEGQFGDDLRRGGYKGRIVSFEPAAAAFCKLSERARRDSGWECWPFALGSVEGRAVLHLSKNSVFNSLLRRSMDAEQVGYANECVGSEVVEVKTLAGIWPQLKCGGERIMLKLDTQGHDIMVVRGAGERLGSILAVAMEMTFRQMYQGQPSADELTREMRSHGLVLLGLWKVCSSPFSGELLEMDALFGRQQFIGRNGV